MSEQVDGALALQEAAPLALFGTTDPLEVIRVASGVATALARVVNEQKLYAVVNGKKFPTVEAWTLLGSMLGVFPVTEWVHELLNEDGTVRGFEARVRAQTLSGRTVGAGEARCIRGESQTWHLKAQEYAVSSMAQTRATSKALRGPLDFVFKLAGFQPTPAEEMTDNSPRTGEILTQDASPETRKALRAAEDIARNSQEAVIAPALTQRQSESLEPSRPSQPSAQQAQGTQTPSQESPTSPAPVEPKRRGRPLGSKNHAKEGAGGSEPASGPPSPAFGDDADWGVVAPPKPDPTDALRKQLHDLASRLRKYQYQEKGAALPSTLLWEKEIERTLGIFIERKFGTDVALEDVEEEGLQESISDLQGFLVKYESAEDGGHRVSQTASTEAGSKPSTSEAQGAGPSATSSDTTIVQLHKPIVRNAVIAPRRGGEATQVDPKAVLEKIRSKTQAGPDREALFGDLLNRWTAMLAVKEGLLSLTQKDEERLRQAATAQIDAKVQSGFGKVLADLTDQEIEDMILVAKQLTPKR